MRFFRIPSFTGIEAHRDDADRGSLRVVEGCLPHGPGGLRSGPVWKKIGSLSQRALTETNEVYGAELNAGNMMLFSCRNCLANDMALFSESGTDVDSVVETYTVINSTPENTFNRSDAVISSVGNRAYAIGDGSVEAFYVGLDPANLAEGETYGFQPDDTLYSEEWSRFPKCMFYARGAKGALFASGNPDRPLTVYVSEPAGKTAPWKDAPYSTEQTSNYAGQLSTVDILGSDASRITALSTRGEQVIAHTDKGSYILYAPGPDQASTGYRVEQAPATNFSGAVNQQVVSGESGSQTFWIGHDGQVYKDEASSRGAADLRSYADEDQANWKSKGAWEHEIPSDVSRSFATFEAQTGNYVFFGEDLNYDPAERPPYPPVPQNISFEFLLDIGWESTRGVAQESDCTDLEPECCKRVNSYPVESLGIYATLQSCVEKTFADGRCCIDAGITDCCKEDWEPGLTIENCSCEDDNSPFPQFADLYNEQGDLISTKEEQCEAALIIDENCEYYELNGCSCERNPTGTFSSMYACELAKSKLEECKRYVRDDECGCVEHDFGTLTKSGCENEIAQDESCWGYSFSGDCDTGCVQSVDGTLTQTECDDLFIETCTSTYYEYSDCNSDCLPTVLFSSQTPNSTQYETYELCDQAQENDTECKTYDITDCECVENTAGTGTYVGLSACEAAKALDNECKSYDLTDCECIENTAGTGTYAGLSACENARSLACDKFDYTDCNSGCVQTENGRYTGLSACESAQNEICQPHDYDTNSCGDCQPVENGTYASLDLCNAAKNLDENYSDMCDSHNWVLSDCTDGCVNYPEGVSRYELLQADPTFEGEMHDTEQACNFAKPYLCESVYLLNETDCRCEAAPYGTSSGYGTLDQCEQALAAVESCKIYRTYSVESYEATAYVSFNSDIPSGASPISGSVNYETTDVFDGSTPGSPVQVYLKIDFETGYDYRVSLETVVESGTSTVQESLGMDSGMSDFSTGSSFSYVTHTAGADIASVVIKVTKYQSSGGGGGGGGGSDPEPTCDNTEYIYDLFYDSVTNSNYCATGGDLQMYSECDCETMGHEVR